MSWGRVEEAYRLLSTYLSSIGIPSELIVVKAFGKSLVRDIRDVLAKANSIADVDGFIEVYLTGGPRILGVALIMASLTSSPLIRRRTRIVVYSENFETKLELNVEKLISYISLDSTSMKLLYEIAKGGTLSTKELFQRAGIPRSTLYKKLKELEEKGLISRIDGKWIVQKDVETLV